MGAASRRNSDESLSYVSTTPGFIGQEFVVNADGNLVRRSPQKKYIFTVADPEESTAAR